MNNGRLSLGKEVGKVDRARIELATHGFSGRAHQKISLFWDHSHNIFTADDGEVLADC